MVRLRVLRRNYPLAPTAMRGGGTAAAAAEGVLRLRPPVPFRTLEAMTGRQGDI